MLCTRDQLLLGTCNLLLLGAHGPLLLSDPDLLGVPDLFGAHDLPLLGAPRPARACVDDQLYQYFFSEKMSGIGGNRCAVSVCLSPTDASYFRFPLRSESLTATWVAACHREDPFIVNNSRICSLHFHKDCYKPDLKHKLQLKPLRVRLKDDAIPTFWLTKCPYDSLELDEEEEEEEPHNGSARTRE